MKVIVKWLKSPIKYGFAKSMGDASVIDMKVAKDLEEKDSDLFEMMGKLEKEKPAKVRTRPVEKKS